VSSFIHPIELTLTKNHDFKILKARQKRAAQPTTSRLMTYKSQQTFNHLSSLKNLKKACNL